MSRFIFDWPDDLAERVEAYRRDRGLKATAEAVRELLNAALATPPVQDTASNGSGDESLQAERRSREPSKPSKPPTPPAKPMKGVQKAPERAGEPERFRGLTATGEPLPAAKPMQKGTKR